MAKLEVKPVQLPNGETIGYRESGSGASVLILIHGNMTSSRHLEPLLVNFPPEFRLIAIDLPGFGNSSYKNQVSSLRDLSETVRLFADQFHLTRFSLLGWSMGGGVAMQLTSDYPERVKRLILLGSIGVKGHQLLRKDKDGSPIPGDFLKTREEIASDPIQAAPVLNAFRNRDKGFLRKVWDFLIYTHNKPADEDYQEYLEDILTQRNYVDIYFAMARFNISHQNNGVVDGTGAVDKIAAPTLVIQGDRDLIIPLQTAFEIGSSIGSNAKLVILPNTGHSPLVDSLAKTISVITGFMD
jgi:pimeloyl-ACP methyl ester carboxylesterase